MRNSTRWSRRRLVEIASLAAGSAALGVAPRLLAADIVLTTG